jgi:hypothetical protein
MWPSEWLRIESESPQLLAACRGLRGQAWLYSTSHSQMLVRFYREGSLAGIYVYCKGCELVQFQSSWLDADVRVEISKGRYGQVYTITDGDRLRIECGAAFLADCPQLVRFEGPGI